MGVTASNIVIQRGGSVPLPANARAGLDLAHELARLRAENDILRAENHALRRERDGLDQSDFIPGLNLTGQAARVCALLRQHAPAVVARERLIAVMRGNGELCGKQLDTLMCRLRRRLAEEMAIPSRTARLKVIRGAFGVGYAMPEETARFLDRFFTVQG